jgi:hypothetical protein
MMNVHHPLTCFRRYSTMIFRLSPSSTVQCHRKGVCAHFAGVVMMLTLAVSFLFVHSAKGQNSLSQQVHLETGWNLVSLQVQPDDRSLSAIFGASADQVHMVKNQEGAVYIPGRDIDQIGVWEVGESYRVYASGPVTIEVAGTAVPLSETPVVLNEGWNLAPYLPNHSQPVSTALTSILGSLERIESEAGTAYEPGGGVADLDSLRPGQGYQVRMTRPDTLVYSEIQDPIVVNTLADALALQGVETGQHVQIRGYHEPGDGGGGLFEVRESACASDGGTCFVFNEDVSAEQTIVTGDTDPNLPHSDLVWGTFSAQVGAEEGEVITDLDMHGGMSWQNGTDPFLDHKAGAVNSASGMNLFGVRRSIGDGDDYDITYRYRYATSDRRLVRMGVTSSVNVAWWGAPEADPANPIEATPYINWAILAAHRLYQQGGIEWAYADIDREYYYHHTIRLRSGTKLRGVGTDRSVPGEPWTTNGKLTVTPGKAMYYRRDSYDRNAENDVRGALGSKAHINNHYLAEKWGIENLELDGNYPNNTQVFDGGHGDVETWLQNSGAWAGFHTNGAGGQSFAQGAVAHFDNVYVHDVGGNGLTTRPNLPVVANNVKGENSVRNHSIYHFWGDVNNLTGKGHSWAVPLKLGSKDDNAATYTDIAYEAGDSNPEGYVDKEVFNIIGRNIVMDGITIDMRAEKNRIGWIADRGTSNTYRNATVYTNESGSWTVQAPRAIPSDELFENFTINSNGDGPVIAGRGLTQSGMTFKDFTVEVGASASGAATEVPLGMPLTGYLDALSMPGRIDIVNLNYNRELGTVFKGGGSPDNVRASLPREMFISGSSFNNTGFFSDDGRWSAFGDTDDNFRDARFYLSNTTMDLPSTWVYPFGNNTDRGPDRHGIGSAQGAAATVKIRNVQDSAGRVSDETGTYTSDASDEGNDFVLIPTNLIYRAWETETTLVNSPSGISSITSVEVANSDGSLRSLARGVNQREPYLKVTLDGTIGAGETVTIDWTARVTPLNEYQTTGVFVSRPVFDKSYTTGNGPWTVDLRGVAVSQESKEQMVYSVSSSDTGVVTASVGADGYTLNLTEVGTGTATITVTGTIEGIGTATDTFEVVVEQ